MQQENARSFQISFIVVEATVITVFYYGHCSVTHYAELTL